MSIWQTQAWQEMLKKSNQTEKYIEFEWMFLEKRSIWLRQFGLFWLGIENIPEINDKKLSEICKKNNSLFVQLETFWIENLPTTKQNIFKQKYFKKFITPFTAIIDLKLSEEDILANMKPKWRYNIKVAKKKWIEVKVVEKTDKNIKSYYDLMCETTSRDNFSGNNFEYYKTFLSEISNSSLLLAYKDEKVVAGWIFVFDKDVSIYYYWASTSDKKYRNLMAPYLLQWTAILKAKEIWSKYYDFLWIASPDEKNSPLAWVTDFKLKLTKNTKNVSTSYMFIDNKLKYNLIIFLRKLKKIIK